MNDGGELTMLNDIKIKNTDELEFAVFCIENIAMRLKKWYRALTEKSDILNSYVIPEYEMLHTQSKEYIVDDIINLIEEMDIQLWFYIMVHIWKFKLRI